MPLIDAQTCNAYYQENSIPSTEPVIFEDMLCAGFEEGEKDACNVSHTQTVASHQEPQWAGRSCPITPRPFTHTPHKSSKRNPDAVSLSNNHI